MNFQLMQLSSLDRFRSRALAVAPSLLGATHTWQMGGTTIDLRLPSEERIKKDSNNNDPVGRLTSYRADGTPLEYVIHEVVVHVFAASHVELPPEVLSSLPNAYDLIPPAQQKELEDIATQQAAIAGTAYEYWLSVMRWVCNDHRIGRYDITKNESGWTTYLLERSSDTRVWGASTCIVIQGLHMVDDNEWEKVQQLVRLGEQIPIYVAQQQDAQALFAQEDYRRCTIDLCIAVETFLRQKVWAILPVEMAVEMRNYVEQANINRYIQKFFPSLLSEEQSASYKSELRPHLIELFECRNKIMHAGARDLATHERCLTYLQVVRSLFALVH